LRLPREPSFDHAQNVAFFVFAQLTAFRNAVPLLQTATAAGRGCVLRDEDRVVALRRLPPVVRRVRRRQPLLDKTGGVFQDCLQAFAEQDWACFINR